MKPVTKPPHRLRRCLTWLLLMVVSMAVPAGVDTVPAHSLHGISHDGLERRYALYAPVERITRKGRLPLVIVLHGGGGNGLQAAEMTGFTRKAHASGFFVAYPYGSGRRDDVLLTWNAGHCCGYAMNKRIDDTGFISVLIDELVRTLPVDPARVYVTGMSNGAMLTHRIGSALANRIAAIAPVVGGLFGDEQAPAGSVPALFINGAMDDSVPIAGGVSSGRGTFAWDGTPIKPVSQQALYWTRANRCNPARPRVTTAASVSVLRYDCPAGREVTQYIVLDNGHAWPGGKRGSARGDEPSTALQATDVIWSFFQRHVRPSHGNQ